MTAFTLLSISFPSLPPSLPPTRFVAFNFDGSNVNRWDFRMLRFEDGGEIPNVKEYLK
jgi:hypothetical protein